MTYFPPYVASRYRYPIQGEWDYLGGGTGVAGGVNIVKMLHEIHLSWFSFIAVIKTTTKGNLRWFTLPGHCTLREPRQ